MNILLTGANGYLGSRLLPVLIDEGHTVFCSVRDTARFNNRFELPSDQILQLDLLNPESGDTLPVNIDIAFYLVHSMSGGKDFEAREEKVAKNFVKLIGETNCRQVIYLTGIANSDKLSKHLSSRLNVEKILASGSVPLTALRAGIIVGSGSASFEIIRDLTEKLPVMIAPRWINTRSQPIAIANVIEFLTGVMGKEKYFGQSYDISCGQTLTYREMLLGFAEVRNLKRWIFTVPVMTPRLSSYWLYFITATSYHLAVNLVDSMKYDVIARPNNLAKELGIELIDYKNSVELAFQKIGQDLVLSSWKDAFSSSDTKLNISEVAEPPEYGVFKDVKTRPVEEDKIPAVMEKIWSIGGDNGWYYGNFLWKVRGYLDKMAGGIGLRRGRTHPREIHPGDSLDFWRVIIANKEEKRLLLFAEMKLPGEAWLEFRIQKKDHKWQLIQTATFRPLGLLGRFYWFMVLPFHFFIFSGLIDQLVKE